MIRAINYRVCRVIDDYEEDVTGMITEVAELVQNIPDAKAMPYTFRSGTTTLEGSDYINPQVGEVFRIYIDGNKMFEGTVPRHCIFHHSNHKVEFDLWSYSYAMKKCDASYHDFVVRDLNSYIRNKLYGCYTLDLDLDFDNYMYTDNRVQSWIPPEFWKGSGDIGAIYVISGDPEAGSMVYAIGVGKHLFVYEWANYGVNSSCLLHYAVSEILQGAIYDDIIKTNINGEDYLIAILTCKYKYPNGGIKKVLYEVVKVKISDWSVSYSYPRPPYNNPLYYGFWGVREGCSFMWVGANTSDGHVCLGWYPFDSMPSGANTRIFMAYTTLFGISDNYNEYFYTVEYSQAYNNYNLVKYEKDATYYIDNGNLCIQSMETSGGNLYAGEENDLFFRSERHIAGSKFEDGQIIKIDLSNYNLTQITNSKKIAGLKHFNVDPGLTNTEVFVNSGTSKGWELFTLFADGLADVPICSNLNLSIPDRNRVWLLPSGYRIMLYEDEKVQALMGISKYVIKTIFGKMEYSARKAFEELAKAWNCIFFVDFDKRLYFVDAKRWIARNRITHQLLHHISCTHSTIWDYDYVSYNGVKVGQIGVTREFLNIEAEAINHLPHLFEARAQEAYNVYGKPWDYWKIVIEHDGENYKIEDYVKFAEGEGIIKGIIVYKDKIEMEVINEQGD